MVWPSGPWDRGHVSIQKKFSELSIACILYLESCNSPSPRSPVEILELSKLHGHSRGALDVILNQSTISDHALPAAQLFDLCKHKGSVITAPVSLYIGKTDGLFNDAIHLRLWDGSLRRDGVGEVDAG